MPLTPEQMRQAHAARRAIEDPDLQAAFDVIVEEAAQAAIYGTVRRGREGGRFMVLAITRLRGRLKEIAEAPDAEKQAEELARTFE